MTLFELHRIGENLTPDAIAEGLWALSHEPRFASIVAMIERGRDTAAAEAAAPGLADHPGRLAFVNGQAYACRLLLAQLAKALAEPVLDIGPDPAGG